MELVQLLMGIAKSGYRGPIKETALSSLVAYAKDYGVEEVLRWIEEDPGLLTVPSWQFGRLEYLQSNSIRKENKTNEIVHSQFKGPAQPQEKPEIILISKGYIKEPENQQKGLDISYQIWYVY